MLATARRQSTAALALALSLALASACSPGSSGSSVGSDEPAPGGEADDRSSLEVVQDAVDATLDLTSASVDLAAMLDIGGQMLELTAEGDVDYEAVVADVTFRTEQAGATQALQILADGESAWLRAEGAAAEAFPDGFAYLRGDATQLGSSDSFAPIDLVGVVVALRGAEEVEDGGTEEVDGVETRSFTTTVAYADAVEAAGDDAEKFQSALSLTGDATVADLLIEVTVGPDDVVRTFDLDIEAGDVPVDGTYELDLTGVGAEVEAPDAPPEDEVATGPEADDLFAQFLAS